MKPVYLICDKKYYLNMSVTFYPLYKGDLCSAVRHMSLLLLIIKHEVGSQSNFISCPVSLQIKNNFQLMLLKKPAETTFFFFM